MLGRPHLRHALGRWQWDLTGTKLEPSRSPLGIGSTAVAFWNKNPTFRKGLFRRQKSLGRRWRSGKALVLFLLNTEQHTQRPLSQTGPAGKQPPQLGLSFMIKVSFGAPARGAPGSESIVQEAPSEKHPKAM